MFVELATPRQRVFRGRAAAAEFSPANAIVQLEPGAASYFGLISSGELVLRIGKEFRYFVLFRATARVLKRRLTIMAEVIEPVSAPSSNCGNPRCDCGAIASLAAPRKQTMRSLPRSQRAGGAAKNSGEVR